MKQTLALADGTSTPRSMDQAGMSGLPTQNSTSQNLYDTPDETTSNFLSTAGKNLLEDSERFSQIKDHSNMTTAGTVPSSELVTSSPLSTPPPIPWSSGDRSQISSSASDLQ